MNKRLFVGGLPFSMTDEGLRKLFEEGDEGITGCGADSVESGAEKTGVVRDRVTGKSKGFGFVQMVDSDAAKKAIERLNGAMLNGRALKVDEAAERKSPPRDGGGYGGRSSGGYGGRSGGGYGGGRSSGGYGGNSRGGDRDRY